MAKDKGSEPEPQPLAIQPPSADAGPSQQPQAARPQGRQRGTDDAFTGRAAQLAVMAELMRLRCNAAIPEVDLGTDVFAFKDDREEVARIQVKACTAPHDYANGSGYSAKFALPLKQLDRPDDRPPLFYALAVQRENKWVDFLVVSRVRLRAYYNGTQKFGYRNQTNNELEITVEFRDTVQCSGQDLTDCRNAWETLPPLQSPPDLEAAIPNQPAPSPGQV